MARLLPFLLFVIGFVALAILLVQSTRPRSDRAYRPRSGPWGFPGAAGGAGRTEARTNWIVTRSALEGVRDAYSSAAVDPDAPLYRCGSCGAFYHQPSVDALATHNGGRCALCRSDDILPVSVA